MQSTVLKCAVEECAYNQGQECHAPAVSVGSDHPMCDTFTKSGSPQAEAQPMIAACQTSECKFNQELACQASGINVARHEQHADCQTFSPA
jgi:hypothetical protein